MSVDGSWITAGLGTQELPEAGRLPLTDKPSNYLSRMSDPFAQIEHDSTLAAATLFTKLAAEYLAATRDGSGPVSTSLTSSEIAVPLPGFERVHVYDPFGNRLELMERRGVG